MTRPKSDIKPGRAARGMSGEEGQPHTLPPLIVLSSLLGIFYTVLGSMEVTSYTKITLLYRLRLRRSVYSPGQLS